MAFKRPSIALRQAAIAAAQRRAWIWTKHPTCAVAPDTATFSGATNPNESALHPAAAPVAAPAP